LVAHLGADLADGVGGVNPGNVDCLALILASDHGPLALFMRLGNRAQGDGAFVRANVDFAEFLWRVDLIIGVFHPDRNIQIVGQGHVPASQAVDGMGNFTTDTLCRGAVRPRQC
jgi:hypothetical protein